MVWIEEILSVPKTNQSLGIFIVDKECDTYNHENNDERIKNLEY